MVYKAATALRKHDHAVLRRADLRQLPHLAESRGLCRTAENTFGAWSVKAGISIRILQKLMGHSTVAVTERYSHAANDDVAAAVNRLNHFLPSPFQVGDGVDDRKSNGMMVPKGGVEPPWPQGPRDFESRASASSATSARAQF